MARTPYQQLKEVADGKTAYSIAERTAVEATLYSDGTELGVSAILGIAAFVPGVLVDIVDRLERIEASQRDLEKYFKPQSPNGE